MQLLKDMKVKKIKPWADPETDTVLPDNFVIVRTDWCEKAHQSFPKARTFFIVKFCT